MSSIKRNLGSNKMHTLLGLECEKLSYKIVSCNVLMFPLIRCESNRCVKFIKYERNITWDNLTRYFSNGEHSCSSSPSFNSSPWQCATLLLNLFSWQYLCIYYKPVKPPFSVVQCVNRLIKSHRSYLLGILIAKDMLTLLS